jgi:hypothetical protein
MSKSKLLYGPREGDVPLKRSHSPLLLQAHFFQYAYDISDDISDDHRVCETHTDETGRSETDTQGGEGETKANQTS